MAFNIAVHDSNKSMPDKVFLGGDIKCPLGVRWDLFPVNNGDVDGASQSFWTRAYCNLKLSSKRVARRYNQTRKPHQYRVGYRVGDRYCAVPVKAE